MPILPKALRPAVATFTRTRLFRRIGPSIMPPLERVTSWLSGGRVQLSGLLVPSLVLHSVGAKSGLERDTPLMYYPETGGTMLVTGSNFARGSHPAWTANLMANPDAAVSLHGRRLSVRAARLDDDEVERVWPRIEQQWPGYREYERAAGRRLRIFRLAPVDGTDGVDD
jgi:deazaflavin-dependent oxidoreductase (nitroreductase family)